MSCGIIQPHFVGSDRVLPTRADTKAIYSRRSWIISQLALLIRNASIPKVDAWVFSVLDWLTLNGLFVISRKNEKSDFIGVNRNKSLAYFTILIVNSSYVIYRSPHSPKI